MTRTASATLLGLGLLTLLGTGCAPDDPRTRQAHARWRDFGPPSTQPVALPGGGHVDAATGPIEVARAALLAVRDDYAATQRRDPSAIVEARLRLYHLTEPKAAVESYQRSYSALAGASEELAIRTVNGWWALRVGHVVRPALAGSPEGQLDWGQASASQRDAQALVRVPATTPEGAPALVQVEVALLPHGPRVSDVRLRPQ